MDPYIKLILSAHYPSSHEIVISDLMRTTKIRVCRACALSPDGYDEAHYNLTEEWFKHHKYLEFTARVFIVSRTYHKWWNQQVALMEASFLAKYNGSGMSPGEMRNALFREIITMNLHPAAELRRKMHQEGMAALKADPSLCNIKIYRHE